MALPKAVLAALPAILFVAALPASAQSSIFVCTDAAGKKHTSDKPPPECLGREIRQLNPDGSLRRLIEPPLTPEQRAARAAEEAQKREAADRQREQSRRDLALLATYSSAEQIEAARTRALAGRQAVVDRSVSRLQQLAMDRKKIDQEAEFYAKRDQPDQLKRAYASNDALRQAEERIIADSKVEMRQIDERYAADARRFRELEASGMAGRRGTSPSP